MAIISRSARARAFRRRWVLAGVLLAFVAVLPLRIVDHRVMERDPWHQHIVLMAVAGWAERLDAHQRGAAPGHSQHRHQHSSTTAGEAAADQEQDGPVLSLPSSSALSALAIADTSPLAAPWLGLVVALAATRLLPAAERRLASAMLPATTPPPRPPERCHSA